MYIEETRKYWSTRSEDYTECIMREYNGDALQIWKNLLEKYMPEGNVLNILDAGCGPGFFPVVLSQSGHTVTAVDYTPEMLKETKKNVNALGKPENVTILRGNIQDLDFDDNTFDMVISRNVMWTLDYPDKAYREWLRVLKPGGAFLNFDSNFLFSLYDEELKERYKKDEEEAIAMGYIPEPNDHLADGMDKVLPELPGASNNRPGWDLEFLAGLDECEKIILDKTVYKGLATGYRDVLDRTNRMFLIKGVKKS